MVSSACGSILPAVLAGNEGNQGGETAYGSQVWADVVAVFDAETGIKVELTTDKNLEDVMTGSM